MTTRRFFLTALAAATAVPLPLGAQTMTRLALGSAPIDSGMPPVIAQKAGIFKKYGLDVDVQMLNSGAAAASAVAGGALQIGGTSLMGLITAHLRNVPFQIVAPASMYAKENPTQMLVVKADSPIRTAADLNGKIVASPALGDLFATATLAWIDQNGGDAKSVHQVELAPAATAVALATGRVDAAGLAEPRLSDGIKAGTIREIGHFYDAIAPNFLISVNFGMADWIAANKDTAVRVARSLLEANAFANAHPDRTAPWLAEVTKVDVDTIVHGRRETFAEALVPANIQKVIDAAARYKAIDHGFDARELISPAVLNLK